MEGFCVKPWLVVEDEEDIRNIVKVMFTAWGHTSIDFRDGNQTYDWLDKVEAGAFQGELPELALLDIKMPGPRGNEIARRMRTFDQFKTIPIVLMTAFTLEDQEIFEKKKARVTASQNKEAEGRLAKTADTHADQVKVANGNPVQATNSDSEKTADTSAKSANE
jgi:CheY-like chemotaxis protein